MFLVIRLLAKQTGCTVNVSSFFRLLLCLTKISEAHADLQARIKHGPHGLSFVEQHRSSYGSL